MSMSEEERQAHLAEVIKLGEDLFEMALASRAQQADVAADETEPGQEATGDVEKLHTAAATFFRVLRKLVAVKEPGGKKPQ